MFKSLSPIIYVALATGALFTAACSSDSTVSSVTDASADTATTVDASADTASTLDASTDAPAIDAAPIDASTDDATLGTCDGGTSCNSVLNGASIVVTGTDPGTLPTFTGGAIVDGTYRMTSATSYGVGAGGQRQRVTMVFSGGAFQLVQDAPGCVSAPSGTGSYVANGSALSLSYTCPVAGSQDAHYTATPTTFSYSTSSGTHGVLFTFTKQ